MHLYPPVALRSTDPFVAPLHAGLRTVPVITIGGEEVISSLNVKTLPFASLMVTEYFPAPRFCAADVVAPFDHE